jgi:hypothetical protein
LFEGDYRSKGFPALRVDYQVVVADVQRLALLDSTAATRWDQSKMILLVSP